MNDLDPTYPAAAADLTPAWLTDVLRAGGTLAADASVVTATAEPFGNGQVAQVLRVTATYEPPGAGPATLVAKLPASEEARRQMAMALGLYDTEVRFYLDIAPRVDLCVPALLGSVAETGTGRFALLLEDLAGDATVGDTVAGATPEQVTAAAAALPALQAPAWDDPALIADPWWGDLSRSHLIFTMVPQVVGVIADRFGPHLDPAHVEVMQWVASVADRLPAQVWQAPFVVVHGDYRLDNMLFSDTTGDVAVIDWQGTRLGPALADLALFVSSTLDVETRRARERELVETFHAGLADRGVEAFDLDECWRRYRVSALYPLCGVMVAASSFAHSDADVVLWSHLLRQTAQMVIDLGTAELIL